MISIVTTSSSSNATLKIMCAVYYCDRKTAKLLGLKFSQTVHRNWGNPERCGASAQAPGSGK